MMKQKVYELGRAVERAADAAQIATRKAHSARLRGEGTEDLDAASSRSVKTVLALQADWIAAIQ